MFKKPKGEGRSRIESIVILLRNTTWKCGRIERLIVNYMRFKLRRFGRAKTPVSEMLQHFKLKGKEKNEFFDAIKRLEKRRIIRIEMKRVGYG